MNPEEAYLCSPDLPSTRRVREANIQEFTSVVSSLFDPLQQKHQHYVLEFGLGTFKEEDDVPVTGFFYYQPDQKTKQPLGKISAVPTTPSNQQTLELKCEFTPDPIKTRNPFSRLKRKTENFIDDCRSTFQSLEIINARYHSDTIY